MKLLKIDFSKSKYIDIDSFSIQIVSNGKETTLKYLINLKYNLLEREERMTTKFCDSIKDN